MLHVLGSKLRGTFGLSGQLVPVAKEASGGHLERDELPPICLLFDIQEDTLSVV